jgi:hypothetical protein
MPITQGTQSGKGADPGNPVGKVVESPSSRQAGAATLVESNETHAENAKRQVGYRSDQVGAREAGLAIEDQVRKDQERAIRDAVPVDDSGFAPNYGNQVPQEGALVETPRQPVPPPYTEEQLREMDHAPLGYREPSVAAGASEAEHYDQTVHPKSRVDDPSKPL